jgi:BirA family transcriptional regulator, biotin operon repressor / biotin---[acetyl-CoA-carboxylase] ligase
MISIPIIRRELTSDLVGRHIYLFGAGAVTTDILKRLAEAGAQEGTVVLTEHAGARLGAAVLFRPHLAPGAAPLFSVIAALALSDAIGNDRFCVTPLWPDQVAIDGETVARGVIETAPAGDPTGYVILGGEIDVPALEGSWPNDRLERRHCEVPECARQVGDRLRRAGAGSGKRRHPVFSACNHRRRL